MSRAFWRSGRRLVPAPMTVASLRGIHTRSRRRDDGLPRPTENTEARPEVAVRTTQQFAVTLRKRILHACPSGHLATMPPAAATGTKLKKRSPPTEAATARLSRIPIPLDDCGGDGAHPRSKRMGRWRREGCRPRGRRPPMIRRRTARHRDRVLCQSQETCTASTRHLTGKSPIAYY